MIVKCISIYPNENQIQGLGPGFFPQRSFGVVVGREYIVVALTVNCGAQAPGKGVWVDILMEPGIPTLVSAPLFLFEIVESSASCYWQVRETDKGGLTLWPSAFYQPSYLEDVANRVPKIVDDFWRIYTLIEAEAKARGVGLGS
jgi:hypothetical protein